MQWWGQCGTKVHDAPTAGVFASDATEEGGGYMAFWVRLRSYGAAGSPER